MWCGSEILTLLPNLLPNMCDSSVWSAPGRTSSRHRPDNTCDTNSYDWHVHTQCEAINCTCVNWLSSVTKKNTRLSLSATASFILISVLIIKYKSLNIRHKRKRHASSVEQGRSSLTGLYWGGPPPHIDKNQTGSSVRTPHAYTWRWEQLLSTHRLVGPP